MNQEFSLLEDMEDYLSEAYQNYSESIPADKSPEPEVEMTEVYPELNAALYRCSLGDEVKEVHVFTEEIEGQIMAAFLTEDRDLRFLNILQSLEEVSSPESRKGENGETFMYPAE